VDSNRLQISQHSQHLTQHLLKGTSCLSGGGINTSPANSELVLGRAAEMPPYNRPAATHCTALAQQLLLLLLQLWPAAAAAAAAEAAIVPRGYTAPRPIAIQITSQSGSSLHDNRHGRQVKVVGYCCCWLVHHGSIWSPNSLQNPISQPSTFVKRKQYPNNTKR